MMRHLPILALLVLLSHNVSAQQQPPAPPNQPIELPEFVVTGKDRVDIPASSKQAPSKPPVLKGARLDSLNDLEKQPLPTMPADPLPMLRRPGLFHPGYVHATMAQYITPAVAAGYTFTTGGYRIDLHGDVELSSGHRTNAEYSKIDVRALSTYVAPDKFIVFGGSTTEADVRMRRRSYRHFAVDSAPERTVTDLGAGLVVDGSYEGYRYHASAAWSMADLATDGRSVTDNVIGGVVAIDTRIEGIDLGGRVDVQFRSFAGSSYPFMEGSAFGRYSTSLLRVAASAGVQSATSTSGVVRGGLLLQGVVDVFLGPDVTVTGTFRSGLRPTTMRDLLDENPYVSDRATVLDASYDIFDLKGMLVYHPTVRFTATAGVRMQRRDRHPMWERIAPDMFAPSYVSVTMLRVPAQLRWIATARDVVTADLEFTSTMVDDADLLPYVPSLRAGATYDRQWSRTLSSTVGIIYIGERWADRANTKSLSGYVDLRAAVRYDIASAWQASVDVHNLLGSDIVLWEGYRERGMFLRAGLLWRF
jgi:hypothetical protein